MITLFKEGNGYLIKKFSEKTFHCHLWLMDKQELKSLYLLLKKHYEIQKTNN